MSTLYVVATPIGNLKDLSPRALETLRQVSLIAAEDTRVTMKLLSAFDIHTPLVSSHRHNESGVAPHIVERMLREDIDAALVTDAGTPCVSDPGWALVNRCREEGIDVVAVPGPCAAAAALAVSGFEVTEFSFYGFLPREKRPLEEKLRAIGERGICAVVYESPFRVKDLVEAVRDTLPGARLCLCAEMTKLHERSYRGTPGEVLSLLTADTNSAKGEYCLVLDVKNVPAPEKEAPVSTPEALIFEQLLAGASLKEARARAQEKVGKNRAYAASLRVKRFLEEQAEAGSGSDE